MMFLKIIYIIGDFNFADKEVDKGKGMSVRDKMMNAPWEEFKSETAMVDVYIRLSARLEKVGAIGFM